MRISTTLEILRAAEATPGVLPGIKNLRSRTVERALRAAGWPDMAAVTEARRRLQHEYEGAPRDASFPRVPLPLNEEAIQVAMTGERTYLRPVERREAVRRLVAQGVEDEEICGRLRVCERTVRRMKREAA